MTTKDKIIIAFLVSLGLFSLGNAAEYVKGLTEGQKTDICLMANTPSVVVLASTDDSPIRIKA